MSSFSRKPIPPSARWQVAEIRQGFGLMFVHFPTGDIIGHEWGWMGGVQMWAFREEDKFLGQMLAALDESGLRQGTLIILSADHGGFQKSHGGDSPEETSIPWIVSGPGVIPGSADLVHPDDRYGGDSGLHARTAAASRLGWDARVRGVWSADPGAHPGRLPPNTLKFSLSLHIRQQVFRQHAGEDHLAGIVHVQGVVKIIPRQRGLP